MKTKSTAFFTEVSQKVKTVHGEFQLWASEKGITQLDFPGQHARPEKGSNTGSSKAMRHLEKAARRLTAYLSGEAVSFDGLEFDLSASSSFEKKILSALSKVRRAERVSYQQLSKSAGFARGARAVGRVMSKNRLPIFLPCHRVLRADGGLGGYGPGLKWKEQLLALEGGSCGWRSK